MPASPRTTNLAFFFILFALSCTLLFSDLRTYTPSASKTSEEYSLRDGEFSWEKLKPSDELVWHECYSSRQCAHLKVPLNYSEPEGERAIIALIKVLSALPPHSPRYRGPILFNPGGPGGSGVDFVLSAGDYLSTIVGPQFDVVGFDPRGVARSMPHVSFFETQLERVLWGNNGGLQVLNQTYDALGRAWARSQVTNQLAAKRQLDALGHINTDQTARDMLQIMRAHGRDKLQYWGFSYGSVLGATFAAMFPDKIERMIIDGVVDIEDYYETLWSTNLLDTDKTLQSFFDDCVAAGPESCPFYAPTADAISKNLTVLLDSVRSRPIPVRTAISYGLLDYNRFKVTIFSVLYKPYASFYPLALGLADLARGNATTLYQLAEVPAYQCQAGEPRPDYSSVPDAQNAILCNDGDPVSSSFEDLQKYYDDMTRASTWGEILARIRIGCIGWPDIPKKRFRGPFIGNTSFPILLIGNTADPVTPLAGAKKVATGFNGSVVLTQDSPGHCSLAAPSVYAGIRSQLLCGRNPAKSGHRLPCGRVPIPTWLSVRRRRANGVRKRPLRNGEEYSTCCQDAEQVASDTKSLLVPLGILC